MRAATLALPALACLACGPSGVPLDGYDPFSELTPQVYLGMRAAEFEAVRPDFYLADDGAYSEIVEPWDLVYFFDPKEDDRPPLLTARLVAVQARVERHDSLRLWSEWQERVGAYARSRRLEPDCWVLDDARATLTQAVFSDSLTWRVSAEIHRGPDGREHEAYLSLRLGRGLLETPWEKSLTRHAVGCETVPRSPSPPPSTTGADRSKIPIARPEPTMGTLSTPHVVKRTIAGAAIQAIGTLRPAYV